jgi:hypothetical protein
MDVQALHHLHPVSFNCFDADIQHIGDLLVCALSDELQDLLWRRSGGRVSIFFAPGCEFRLYPADITEITCFDTGGLK